MKNEVHKMISEKMDKTVSVLKDELMTIRAGRANPHLLDKITVEYYGSQTPLSQLANVTVPEPRMLQINPYDVSAISEIEKAIMSSDLGMNPSNDGKIIRLSVPMLTEERRKDLVKQVKKTGENAKVAIRNERREANDKLKKMHKSGDLTDDDLKSVEEDVQKLTDKHIKSIDEMINSKEAEVLEV
jgi:ribosome recycling factor